MREDVPWISVSKIHTNSSVSEYRLEIVVLWLSLVKCQVNEMIVCWIYTFLNHSKIKTANTYKCHCSWHEVWVAEQSKAQTTINLAWLMAVTSSNSQSFCLSCFSNCFWVVSACSHSRPVDSRAAFSNSISLFNVFT